MKATVCITLKPGLLDAQGKTIKSALESLGFTHVTEVRMGKYLEIALNGTRASSAKKEVERMCQKLLANPIIENYHIEMAHGFGLRARAVSSQPRVRAKQT